MKKEKTSRVIDLILLLITTASVGAISYFLYNVKVLPFRLRLGVIAIIAIIYLLVFVLYFKKLKKVKLWTYRFMMVAFTIAFVYGSFYSYKASNSIKSITGQKDGYITISVVSKNESPIQKEKDLKGKLVGVQDSHDKENAVFGQTNLNKTVKNVNYDTSDNYVSMADKLDMGEIDAMIIPNASLQNLDTIKEGYRSTLKTITSYQKKITTKTSPSSSKDLTKEPFTILLSGVDTTDTGDSNLSDVNMVLIVNPLSNHIEMVSFPRDAYVPNMALGGGLDKLTHLGNNGVENTMKSLEEIIGFELDFYVQVNFTSVLKIVDALGGIVVDVPITVSEQNSERKAQMVQLTEGPNQLLNGEQALALARHRESYGDVERTKAQQSVLKAIITKLASKDGALQAPKILDIVAKYVKTDISETQINDFVSYELDHLAPWTLGNTTLEHGDGDMLPTASAGSQLLSVYILNFDDVERLFQTHYMVFHPLPFNKFKFDLNDTYKGLPKLKKSLKGKFLGDYIPSNNYYEEDDSNYEDVDPYIPPKKTENNNTDTNTEGGNSSGTGTEGGGSGGTGTEGGGSGGTGTEGGGSGGTGTEGGGSTEETNPGEIKLPATP